MGEMSGKWVRRALVILSSFLLILLVIEVSNNWGQRVRHSGETFPPLLFVRNGDIWVLSAGRQKRLIKDGHLPAWSKDRRQIAFVRGQNVWVASSHGNHQNKLTHFPTKTKNTQSDPISQITWHPKGDMIAFDRVDSYHVSRVGEEPSCDTIRGDVCENLRVSNIYVYLLRDFPFWRRTMLWLGNETSGMSDTAVCTSSAPCFSPDGKKLAFARNYDLWIADSLELEGKPWELNWDWHSERFAAVAYYDGSIGASIWSEVITHISWSGDGKWLAYDRQRLGGSGIDEIWVISALNPSVRKLVADGHTPTMDPTGKWIAYANQFLTKDNVTSWEIRCVSLDGKTNKLLVRDAEEPAW